MKKFINFIVIILIATFFAMPVFAEDGISITKIVGSSDNSNVVLNATDKIDIQFNELEQSAIYDITLKNNTDKVIYIHDVISENLSEEFIDFSLSANSVDKKIEPNKEVSVGVLVETLDLTHAGRNVDDEVSLKLVYGNSPINPNTSSNVIILFSLVFIILLIYLLITKRFSQLKGLSIFIFVGLLVSYSSVLANNNFVIIKGNVKYSSKNLLQSSGVTLNKGVLDYSNATGIWKEADKVKKIVISDTKSKIEEYEKKFDLTADASENVLGYFINNSDDNVPYDLHIQSDGVIYAPNDSTALFAFSNVESIEGLGYVEFDETTKMTGMFKGNKKLKTIDTSAIDFSDAIDTSYMFNGCNELEISEDDFNVENVSEKNNMFPSKLTIISGDYDTIGSEVCIDSECFYVISSTDDSVTMFAKYNLNIGNIVTYIDTNTWESIVHRIEKPTGIQDANAVGEKFNYFQDDYGNEYWEPILPFVGTIDFSETAYWVYPGDYPPYVYNQNSNLYTYVENYKLYLESLYVKIEEARLISGDEQVLLGCDYGVCTEDAPDWLFSTSYWTGTACSDDLICTDADGNCDYSVSEAKGIRPVITILKSEF